MLTTVWHFTKNWLAIALSATVTLGFGSAFGAPPPIEHFTKHPIIDNVVVSPSGHRMALLLISPAGRQRLAVMSLDPIGEARIVGGFADADIRTVQWVSDDRLVYQAYEADAAVIREGKAGTFAVNFDGSESRQLIAWVHAMNETASAIRSRILPYGWFLGGTIDDASNEVFVYRRVNDSGGDLKHVQLARLNTSTGRLKNLSYGMPEGTRAWYVDETHEPRLLVAYGGGREKIHWRGRGSETWTEVADFDPLVEGFSPWIVDRGGEVFVTARLQSDSTGLYKFDPIAKRLDPEPLVLVAGFDLNPRAEVDSKTKRLVGLHFKADRPMSYWFDDKLGRIQRGIDAALPAGRSNRLYCGRCESSRFIVIRSSSDRQPSEYFLFDRSKSSLQQIGASRPWIEESAQSRRTLHRVAARDGLSMPMYVTHPADPAPDKPLPAVVLVHGGPWVRGSDLSWEAEAQFLASRGYRVLQPEFRGSEGYGFRHFKAGWKEWGRAMQDDLVDAVQWAAAQGLIDPKRVCIVGGSYGGYAALMGPISHPDTYRCAASFAGVTDIQLMYDISWSDLSEDHRRYGMPVLIGDPVKDAERLDAASPLKRVAEIKVPLFLAHGAADRRVPIEHTRKFVDAAKRARVGVETQYYSDEGHGFSNPANHADYFGRLERFLERSLKTPP